MPEKTFLASTRGLPPGPFGLALAGKRGSSFSHNVSEITVTIDIVRCLVVCPNGMVDQDQHVVKVLGQALSRRWRSA